MSDDFQRGLQARLAHLIGEASQWARGSGAHPPGLVKAFNEAFEYGCAEIERLRDLMVENKHLRAEIERLQRRVAEPHPGTGVKCAHCNGSGKEAQVYDEQTGWSDEKACDTCNGSGRITTVEQYLKTLPANWHEDSGLATWFPITADEIERLRTENARLREDAARYRWLRSLNGACDAAACVTFNIGFDWIEQHGAELDAAIDHARGRCEP